MKKQAGLILGLVFSLVLALVSGGCEEPWPPVEVFVSGYTDGQVSVFAIIVRNGSTRLLNIDVRASLHGNRLLGSATNGIPDANSQHPAKNYGDYIGWVNLEPIGPRADQGPFVFVVENTGEGPVTHVWVKFKTETTEGEVSTPIKRARLVDEADPVERAFIDRVRSLLLGN